jgi:ribosomal protein L19
VKTELLDAVENKSLKENVPHFEVGDTIDVHCKIKEGSRERTQVFTGTVIARKGRGINETFTVRRIISSEGVERIAHPKRKNQTGKIILSPQESWKSRQTRQTTQRPH